MLRLGALIVSFLVAVWMSAQWMTFVQAFHGASVGQTDALFGRDIGYYLFQLPAVSAVLGVLLALTGLSLLAAAAVYVLRGQLPLGPRQPPADRGAEAHVGTLLAVLFVLAAARLWIVRRGGTAALDHRSAGRRELHRRARHAARHSRVGRGGADRRGAGGPTARCAGDLLRWAAIAVGGVRRRRLRRARPAAAAVQRLVVAPNELARETPVPRVSHRGHARGVGHRQRARRAT